jgi:hypothetical protein
LALLLLLLLLLAPGVEHPGVLLVYPDELGLPLTHVDHASWDEELLIPALSSHGPIFFFVTVKDWELDVELQKHDCWRHGSNQE